MSVRLFSQNGAAGIPPSLSSTVVSTVTEDTMATVMKHQKPTSLVGLEALACVASDYMREAALASRPVQDALTTSDIAYLKEYHMVARLLLNEQHGHTPQSMQALSPNIRVMCLRSRACGRTKRAGVQYVWEMGYVVCVLPASQRILVAFDKDPPGSFCAYDMTDPIQHRAIRVM